MMAQRRPVIVGVGQIANKDDDRMISPLDAIESAVRVAVSDSGTSPLGRVGGVFLSPPWAKGSETAADDLAQRLGLAAGIRRGGAFSGSMPQELLAAACVAIGDGRVDAAIVAGGVADASVQRAVKKGVPPLAPSSAQWSWTPAERQERVPLLTAEAAAGLNSAGASFAMIESRLAHGAGRTPREQRKWLGTVMAQFTDVAAQRPELAWFPRTQDAATISRVHSRNRLVAEPYTKLMNSFPNVDQAAAMLVMSSALADEMKIPENRRVYPRSIATCHEAYPPSRRPEISEPAALKGAVDRASHAAGIDLNQVTHFDLYSCFPASVQMAAAALDLDVMDPRRLTVTGGLPYFGGPGAAYVAHSIATMVDLCRGDPGSIGAVVAVGGLVSNFAVGFFSTTPGEVPFLHDDCADIEARLAGEKVAVDLQAEGLAVVEAMTVLHDRDNGPNAAPVFARFPDGRRTGAVPISINLASELSETSLIGHEVCIKMADGVPVYDPV